MTRQEEQSQYTPDTFKVLLKKLTQVPDDFTPEDVAQCFRHLCRSDGKGATEAQVRPFTDACTKTGSLGTESFAILGTVTDRILHHRIDPLRSRRFSSSRCRLRPSTPRTLCTDRLLPLWRIAIRILCHQPEQGHER
jgi:hypothetical protein